MNRRLPPAGPERWSEPVRAILGRAVPAAEGPEGEGPPNILYTIAHHPTLLPSFLGFSAVLATQGVLARRDSELLALRTAWNCRSAFEWGHHVEYGLAAGLTAGEIGAVPDGPDEPRWTERDRLLLRVADRLHIDHDLPQSLFAALGASFEPAAIVEIVFVVGQYTMLSMVANATGVPLEARLPPLPER